VPIAARPQVARAPQRCIFSIDDSISQPHMSDKKFKITADHTKI
jgi:hypothetical protein